MIINKVRLFNGGKSIKKTGKRPPRLSLSIRGGGTFPPGGKQKEGIF
jgi:hypothetical protein